MSEIVPGFGDEALVAQERYRRALTRRVLYPILVGAIVGVITGGTLSSTLAGGLGGFLLVWPAFMQQYPAWRYRPQWSLAAISILYILVVFAAAGLAAFGAYSVEFLRTASGGNILGYLRDKGMEWAIQSVATVAVITLYSTIRKSRRRDE
jgi:uncharacterized protein involved in response to NO